MKMRRLWWRKGDYTPILSFDDAEKMYTYLDDPNDPEGQGILELLREFFFIKHTKEQQNFHVLTPYKCRSL